MNTTMGFRIIVIDDNPDIHDDFIKILTTKAATDLDNLSNKLFGKKTEDLSLPMFEITTAYQGQEGILLVEQAVKKNQPYSLAFVDIRMPPGLDGIETIKQLWEIDKDLQVVICTAYSDYSWEEMVEGLGKTDNLLILKKPFDHIAVRQLACALTKKWELLRSARNYTTALKEQVDDRTESLQKSLSLVKATLESSNDGILVLNEKGKIIDYNQKFISMWGIPQNIVDEMDEHVVFNYIKNNVIDSEEFLAKIMELYTHTDSMSIINIKFVDGRIVDCFSHTQKLNDKTVGLVLNFHDSTARAKLEEKLQYQAMHDSLTGLPNRIMLLDKIKQAIHTSDQNHTLTALMFLDLDRFKLINDSLSHAVGDELLQETSSRLHATMRIEDTLARLGGDEFVLVFTNISHEHHIQKMAEKIHNLFLEPFSIAGRKVTVTASIGISIYPKNGTTVNALLSNADAAMYNAKKMGSNNFQFYTEEMNEDSLTKLDQESQLRNAIRKNELFLCYQPEYDILKNKIMAVEALIRWRHPEKGILLPIDFIPLAEETGLIVSIGEWVIRTACKQNKAWQNQGLPPIRVAVNVVSQQLKQNNFVETVRNIIHEYDLDPKYLEIELTENVIISSIDIMKTVTELKALGVVIAVDDFGTGYSSLSYLNKIPLDRLKIDGSFIKNIVNEEDDDVIIRTVIAMAHNLNLEVIAEGVETKNQLDFLKSNKCGEVQGFYYSEPLTTGELELRLEKSVQEESDIT